MHCIVRKWRWHYETIKLTQYIINYMYWMNTNLNINQSMWHNRFVQCTPIVEVCAMHGAKLSTLSPLQTPKMEESIVFAKVVVHSLDLNFRGLILPNSGSLSEIMKRKLNIMVCVSVNIIWGVLFIGVRKVREFFLTEYRPLCVERVKALKSTNTFNIHVHVKQYLCKYVNITFTTNAFIRRNKLER